MQLSIGFDTIAVNNRRYSADELSELFDLFVPLGVKNFVFLFEFDFARTSFLDANKKISMLEDRLSEVTPRGVHSIVKPELIFDNGAPYNSNLSKLYASRAKHSLFVSLPIFPNTDDNVFAADLNRLIYRSGSFPIFTSFENIVETAPADFTSKLSSTGVGLGFDINYLLRADRNTLTKSLIDSNAMIFPMLSHELANYVGIVNEISYFQEICGKSQYYKLCTRINLCAAKAGL